MDDKKNDYFFDVENFELRVYHQTIFLINKLEWIGKRIKGEHYIFTDSTPLMVAQKEAMLDYLLDLDIEEASLLLNNLNYYLRKNNVS